MTGQLAQKSVPDRHLCVAILMARPETMQRCPRRPDTSAHRDRPYLARVGPNAGSLETSKVASVNATAVEALCTLSDPAIRPASAGKSSSFLDSIAPFPKPLTTASPQRRDAPLAADTASLVVTWA